ncbi:MAG: hypothetical protein GY792_02305 [Gammaproteobacteria bacterium]|nr:hypothetical protein [Gammaproteobacteria bacterium]
MASKQHRENQWKYQILHQSSGNEDADGPNNEKNITTEVVDTPTGLFLPTTTHESELEEKRL